MSICRINGRAFAARRTGHFFIAPELVPGANAALVDTGLAVHTGGGIYAWTFLGLLSSNPRMYDSLVNPN